MTLSMTRSAAETLGLKALGWLINSPDELGRFLNISGSGTDELHSRAADPVFLGAILEFLLTDDSLLSSFCEAEGVDYRQVHVAAGVLEGA
jgi:hypothetical protein